jgi:hypothetical protein
MAIVLHPRMSASKLVAWEIPKMASIAAVFHLYVSH